MTKKTKKDEEDLERLIDDPETFEDLLHPEDEDNNEQDETILADVDDFDERGEMEMFVSD